MAKGTVTQPKPPTARQIKKVFTTFEPIFNEIVALTKQFDPNTIAGREGAWIRDAAFQLHGNLKALHDHIADEERETTP